MKITFYKSALNSNYQGYDSPIMSFSFPAKISEEQAITKAIEQFQTECKCNDWREIADFYKLE